LIQIEEASDLKFLPRLAVDEDEGGEMERRRQD
jgi:hypothetical protein